MSEEELRRFFFYSLRERRRAGFVSFFFFQRRALVSPRIEDPLCKLRASFFSAQVLRDARSLLGGSYLDFIHR